MNLQPCRDERGRLLPGSTANPRGRPRRTRPLAERLDAIAAPEAEALVTMLLARALGGDVGAAKLLCRPWAGAPRA